MSALYILDGYNVIWKIPKLREIKSSRGLEESRKALAAMLSDINRKRPRIKFKVIFDGKDEEMISYSRPGSRGMDCSFTKSGEEADDYIGMMLKNRKDNAGVVVISADNKVRNMCKIYGALAQEPLALLKLLGNHSKVTKTTKSDEKDIRQQNAGDITKWYIEQLKKKGNSL